MLIACCLYSQLFRDSVINVIAWISKNVFTIFIYSWFFQGGVMFIAGGLNISWQVTSLLMLIAGPLGPIFIIFVYQNLKQIQCKFLDSIIGIRTAA